MDNIDAAATPVIHKVRKWKIKSETCVESDLSSRKKAHVHIDHAYSKDPLNDWPASTRRISTKELFSQFHQDILVAPNITCDSCKKLYYPSNSIHDICLDDNTSIQKMLYSLDITSKRATLCSPSYNKMKCGTVPSHSHLNDMSLTPIPDELNVYIP
jgi:hypothetical protein